MSEEARRRPRASEVVEKGVEGIYDFLYRLANTAWTVTRHPRRAVTLFIKDRHGPRPQFVYPYTFAAVGVFLVSIVAGVAGYNLLHWIWYYEEIQKNVVERLNEGVSFVTVAIGSIPAFIFMLGLAAGLSLLFRRRLHRGRRALFVTCYAIGTQSIYVFLTATFLSLAQALPGGVAAEGTQADLPGKALGYLLAILLLGSLLSAILVPVLLLGATLNRRRRTRSSRTVVVALVSVASLAALLILPVVASIPTRVSDAVKPPSEPEMRLVSDVSIRRSPEGFDVEADVTIRNRSEQVLGLASADVDGIIIRGAKDGDLDRSNADSLGLEVIRVEDERGAAVNYIAVEPKSVAWRRLLLRYDGGAEAMAAIEQASAKCLKIRMGSGSDEAETQCVRASFEFDREESAERDEKSKDAEQPALPSGE